ncbi:MAG: phosphate signaling complex protein PhoU [Gemmatimonadota bacterium]
MSQEDSARATRHFDQELDELRGLLLRMAGLAEEQVRSALAAVKRLDGQGANQTILADRGVDALELEIEELAISLLARRQPMAGDLRILVAVLKISNDLERVGDHAVNIAQCAKRLAEAYPMPQPSELDQMAELSTAMLRDSISAFIERDVALARNVCIRDEEVDRYNDTVFRLMLSQMGENTNTVIPALQMMLVSRNLERVADLATNLAEDVIYIVEARTIKHHADDTEGEFDQ